MQRGSSSLWRQPSLQDPDLGGKTSGCYVAPADPFLGTRGRTERETAPTRRGRRVDLCGAAAHSRCSCIRRRRGRGHAAAPAAAGASGIVPPSDPPANISPQVTPHCNFAIVDDTSAACIDSVLHNINCARWLEGLGPMVLPERLRQRRGPHPAADHHRRGTGGPGPLAVLGPRSRAQCAALTGAQNNADPVVPAGYHQNGWGLELRQGLHAALGGLRLDVRRRASAGPTSSAHSRTRSGCWGHRDNILGPWTTITAARPRRWVTPTRTQASTPRSS